VNTDVYMGMDNLKVHFYIYMTVIPRLHNIISDFTGELLQEFIILGGSIYILVY